MTIPPAFQLPENQIQQTLTPKTTNITQTTVDWTKFLEGGYHTLLQGRTGAGKTTLLLTLLKKLHQQGHRILMRDDGGLEFLHLLPETPILAWIPTGCNLTIDTNHPHEIRKFKTHHEILDNAYNNPTRFQVIIYDAYCIDPGPAASFYSQLLRSLIYRCMQTPREDKQPLVFSFDELNDLIQPQGRALTREHTKVKHLLEYNIRKLRKHRVTLIASTHRFNQIGINVRSQFSYIFIKQSYGSDVYDFINRNLVTAADTEFWNIIQDLTTMDPWYTYLFDYRNNFDKITYPDIPRPHIPYQLDGEVTQQQKTSNQYDAKDLYITYARTRNPPISYRDIAKKIGLAHSTVAVRAKKLRKTLYLKQHIK